MTTSGRNPEDSRAEREKFARKHEALGKVAEAADALEKAQIRFEHSALDAQDAGASLMEIAERTGRSKSTLADHLKDLRKRHRRLNSPTEKGGQSEHGSHGL
jgi:hypothetical protein